MLKLKKPPRLRQEKTTKNTANQQFIAIFYVALGLLAGWFFKMINVRT
jgi:hypothetical protein